MEENNSTSTTNSETPTADQPSPVSNTDTVTKFISTSPLATSVEDFVSNLALIDPESISHEDSVKILHQVIRRLDRLQVNEFIFTDVELYSLSVETHLQNTEITSKVAVNDYRWAIFLSLVMTKLYPADDKDALFEHILKVGKESKHGSLTRHITIFAILSSVNIQENELVFARVVEELRFLLEFLFNEVFPIIQNPDEKYLKEEI